MTRRNKALAALLAATASCIVITACKSEYRRVDLGNEDYSNNYDNGSPTSQGYATADWPVNFVFYGPGVSMERVVGLRRVGSLERSLVG